MITALSLNPSIDRTLTVPKFTYGGLNRVSSEKQDAGGKGHQAIPVGRQA